MRRAKNTRQWLVRHRRDQFVKRSRARGYRSRSAFKLIEIDDRDRFLVPGATVVDLGAAPGGWSQVVAERIGATGRGVALDLLEMEPVRGVQIIQGDFGEASVLAQLRAALGDRGVGVVLSDMAPNISGVRSADTLRALHLAELTLEFAVETLNRGGSMLVKVFQGPGVDDLRATMNRQFRSVAVRKPAASRSGSRELYLLGGGYGV